MDLGVLFVLQKQIIQAKGDEASVFLSLNVMLCCLKHFIFFPSEPTGAPPSYAMASQELILVIFCISLWLKEM